MEMLTHLTKCAISPADILAEMSHFEPAEGLGRVDAYRPP